VSGKPYQVLLVEDDQGDAGLVRIAMRRGRHDCMLHHVKNGMEALAFLRRIGPHREAPRPGLILLDLNLPGRSGHEILDEIKTDPTLRAIPVVVLSTSEAERDVLRAYQLGANSFVTKPMDVEAITTAVHGIQDYWFGLVQLPR
jgi:CheY-like chemotaxis protein